VCLPCGHSCCVDCAALIRKCALCRHRLPQGFQSKPNFAFVSLLDRLNRPPAQQQSQQTQTEAALQRRPTLKTQPTETTAFLNGKTMTVQIKKNAIQLSLK